MLQEPQPAPGHFEAAEALQKQCADSHETALTLNRATAAWHVETPANVHGVLLLHATNFELWHLEDAARDPHSTDAEIAATKRSIDAVNQRRNDTTEQIDATLLEALHTRGLPSDTAPLHSETPGQMLDRLSILSLKLFHSKLEAERPEVDQMHRDRNLHRTAVLRRQQQDLADCLSTLWAEVISGTRRFKLYRQLKMYNDPALNPVLYAVARGLSVPVGPAPPKPAS